MARNLSDAERTGLAAAAGAGRATACSSRRARRGRRELLGAARLEIGRRCGLIDESAWSFLWVVDAPMFEEDGVRRVDVGPPSLHRAAAEWADKFTTEPGEALADAYDIVCNGYEIGGGSIRIHRPRCSRPSST